MNPTELSARLTSYSLWLVEGVLGLRLILRFFNSDATNRFVSWLYETTQPLLTPVENFFPPVKTSGFVLEMSTLFAMIAYAFVAFVLMAGVGTWAGKARAFQPKQRFSISFRNR